MLEILKKPWKSIELFTETNDSVIVSEGELVTLTVEETGEMLAGTITKIEGKKITVHQEGEIGDNVFAYTDLSNIEIGDCVDTEDEE